jgi:hypothetical protein
VLECPLRPALDRAALAHDEARRMPILDQADVGAEPKRPSWGSFLVGAFVGLLVGGALGVAAMAAGGAPGVSPEAQVEPPSATAPTETEAEEEESKEPEAIGTLAAAPPSVPKAPQGLLERAARGEQEAINQVEAKEPRERLSQEVLAISEGRAAVKARELEQLEKRLNQVPRAGREPETIKRLRELAYDTQVGVATLKMLANVNNEVGADLLFAIHTRPANPDFVSELAKELLYSKDVYAKASEAMRVILDLRSVKDCEAMLSVMDRAKAHSDQRALLSLQPFYSRKGCGLGKENDCWPCLRDKKLLEEATVAARTRAPP